ncbi:retropepsin-like aspartic protease [Rheinheimera pleomorphica]|uniref:retropepsin-like aspartic protease n=1 Tax=Rheinheimera pleomorphica TaxID=2703963 RepID=UPI00141E5B10|nr:retropepsin-like aspartic protease [Rheinheimera pleomorphica]
MRQAPILSALALLSVVVPAEAAVTSYSMPMHLNDRGHAYVYASFNGLPDHPMIVDSAAQQGVLPLTLLAPLALHADKLDTTTVTSATGTTEMTEGVVDSTAVGGALQAEQEYIFADMSGLSLPDGTQPGLLGHDFLRHYCVDMNFAEQRLTLTPGQCDSASLNTLHVVDIDSSTSLIRASAVFNGQAADVLFDTGAHHSFINSALAQQLTGLTVTGEEQTQGLTGPAQPRKVLQGLGYQLGNAQVSEPKAFQADLHVFTQLGYQDKPFMLMGLRAFRNGRLVLDYANQKLYFRQ